MTVNQDKLRPVDLAKEFNGELEESLFRIENVLNYYNNNEDQDILKKEPENAKHVCNFCDLYFNLRGILEKKYGFDYGMSEKKWEPDKSGKLREIFYLPDNKTGINVDPELLEKDSKLHKMVTEMIDKIGERN